MKGAGSVAARTIGFALLFGLADATVGRAQTPTYAGRALTDVLRELQARGLKLVYTSEIVRPELRVDAEPTPAGPREILDAVLEPHGLEARPGPRDTLLIVRRRRPPVRAGPGDPAASGGVEGIIVDARTGQPLAGVVVAVPGRGSQVISDADGAFSLSGLPPGPLSLFVSLVGYSLAKPFVEIRAGTVETLTVPLSDGTTTYSERITVRGDTFSPNPTVPAQRTMTSAELQKLRGVLTDDPFRAVQSLPGVSTGNDLRSEFSVRASDFRHMGLSIDGLPAPWLVHNVQLYETKGSISALNSDVIDSLTVSAGAQPQDHPGRTGAWVDVRIREGSRTATGFHGAVSMTSASGVADGPLGSAGRGSWLVSFRQSYLQWLLGRLDTDSTLFGFTDSQAKIAFDVSARHQLQAGLVAGRARLEQPIVNPGPNELRDGTSLSGLGWLAWRSTLATTVVVDQRIGLVATEFENTHASGLTLAHGQSLEPSYALGLTWSPQGSVIVRGGGLFQRRHTTADEVAVPDTPAGPPEGQRTDHVDGTAWTSSVDGQLSWFAAPGWGIDTGVRLSRSTLVDETTLSPWLLGSAPIGGRFSVRAGVSLPRQFPDVDQVVGSFGAPDAESERARALDVTLEATPTASVQVQAVFYDRREERVLRLEDSETRTVDGRLVFASSLTPAWRNALDGRARGVELVVRRRAINGVGGWIAYAYGRSRYADRSTGETFWADLDQRHSLNLFGEGRLSPRTGISLKLRLGSGVPVPGYLEERADGLFAGATRNAVRVPSYARLDVRADRTFNYQRSRLTLFAEVVNVLNRTNYAPDQGAFLPTGRALGFTTKQFPVLPSVGVLFEF